MKAERAFFIFNLPKPSSDEPSNLVILISHFIHKIGLSTELTQKVHWAANVATFCFLSTCILQVVAIFMAKDDPDRLFECFSILAFCCMGVLKLRSLRLYSNRWHFLLRQISDLEDEQLNYPLTSAEDYESDDEGKIQFSKYVHDYTDKFQKTSTIFRRVYSFTAVIFIISPFLEHFVCILLGNECLEYPHILPGWTPLDFHFLGYLVTVFCEFLAAVYCVNVHIVFDLTAVGVMIFVCGQFSLLHRYSARVGGSGRKCNISQKRDQRARFRIRNCHRTNMILIESLQELDKLLYNIIGVYFLLATLTLCSVAVRLKSEDMSVMQLVTLLQYMCGTLTQLFLFCQYGDAVLNESAIGQGQGPFAAAHWCLSPRIRRDLALLSIGMIAPGIYARGPSIILICLRLYRWCGPHIAIMLYLEKENLRIT